MSHLGNALEEFEAWEAAKGGKNDPKRRDTFVRAGSGGVLALFSQAFNATKNNGGKDDAAAMAEAAKENAVPESNSKKRGGGGGAGGKAKKGGEVEVVEKTPVVGRRHTRRSAAIASTPAPFAAAVTFATPSTITTVTTGTADTTTPSNAAAVLPGQGSSSPFSPFSFSSRTKPSLASQGLKRKYKRSTTATQLQLEQALQDSIIVDDDEDVQDDENSKKTTTTSATSAAGADTFVAALQKELELDPVEHQSNKKAKTAVNASTAKKQTTARRTTRQRGSQQQEHIIEAPEEGAHEEDHGEVDEEDKKKADNNQNNKKKKYYTPNSSPSLSPVAANASAKESSLHQAEELHLVALEVQIEALQQQAEMARREGDEAKQQLETSRLQLKELEMQLSIASAATVAAVKDKVVQQHELRQQQQEVLALKQQLSFEKQQVKEKETNLVAATTAAAACQAEKQSAIDRYLQAAKEADKRIASLEKELTVLQQKMDKQEKQWQQELDGVQTSLQTAQAEVQSCQKEVGELKAGAQVLQAANTELTEHVSSAKAVIKNREEQLQLANEGMKAERATANKLLEAAKQAEVTARKEIVTVQQEVVLMKNQLNTNQAQLSTATSALQQAREEVQGLVCAQQAQQEQHGKETEMERAQAQIAIDAACKETSLLKEQLRLSQAETVSMTARLMESEKAKEQSVLQVNQLASELHASVFAAQQAKQQQEQIVQTHQAELKNQETALRAAEAATVSVQGQLEAVSKEWETVCEQNSTLKQQYEMVCGQLSVQQEQSSQEKQVLKAEIEGLNTAKISDEMVRRKLHNTVQDLKGAVRVFCRVRPSASVDNNNSAAAVAPPPSLAYQSQYDATSSGMRELLQVEAPAVVGVDGTKHENIQHFSFDKVFTEQASQQEVFQELSPLITSAMDGYNVTVFAYGQTGSGKTHTMMGPDGGKKITANLSKRGVIPRAVEQIFTTMDSLQALGWTYSLSATMLEIYNEKISDLLQGAPGCTLVASSSSSSGTATLSASTAASLNGGVKKPLHATKKSISSMKDSNSSSNSGGSSSSNGGSEECKIHYGKNNECVVTNLTEVSVSTPEEVISLLAHAAAHRATGSTLCNQFSSRSHTVFQLKIKGTFKATTPAQAACPAPKDVSSILSLVDLAGSERLKHSQADGIRGQEAIFINKSLSALTTVINAVLQNSASANRSSSGSKGGSSSGSSGGSTFVNFRDSALTYLLMNSLGGSAKTLFVVNLAPEETNWAESKNTLAFAQKLGMCDLASVKQVASKQKAVGGK